MSKLSHVIKVKLIISSIFVVADQIYDIVLIVSLFLMKQFEFAAIFLLVDLLPAVFIILHHLRFVRLYFVIINNFGYISSLHTFLWHKFNLINTISFEIT